MAVVSAVSIAEAVMTWAMASIADTRARHDGWLALRSVASRGADKCMDQLKREARLDWRTPEQKRPPSGTFAGVHAALEHAKAPTAKVDTSELLATIIKDEESKP